MKKKFDVYRPECIAFIGGAYKKIRPGSFVVLGINQSITEIIRPEPRTIDLRNKRV